MANSSYTVFDFRKNNPGMGGSHLTHHANMFGLCKVGLMPFEQARTFKGQRVCVCVCLLLWGCLFKHLQTLAAEKRPGLDRIQLPVDI